LPGCVRRDADAYTIHLLHVSSAVAGDLGVPARHRFLGGKAHPLMAAAPRSADSVYLFVGADERAVRQPSRPAAVGREHPSR